MKFKSIITALAFAMNSTATVAADDKTCPIDLVCASNPQSVVAALQNAGFRAQLEEHKDGAIIKSAAGGYNFYIYANDCEAGLNCTSLQFNILFAPYQGQTAEYANSFNLRYRYIQAAARENKELRLTYDITTTGGLTRPNFSAIVENWTRGLGAFAAYAREQALIAKQPSEPSAVPK